MPLPTEELERMVRGVISRLVESERENKRLQARLDVLETWADRAPAYIDNQRVGSRLASIDARLVEVLALKQGPPGKDGRQGPPGKDGNPGRDGDNAATVIREVKIVG